MVLMLFWSLNAFTQGYPNYLLHRDFTEGQFIHIVHFMINRTFVFAFALSVRIFFLISSFWLVAWSVTRHSNPRLIHWLFHSLHSTFPHPSIIQKAIAKTQNSKIQNTGLQQFVLIALRLPESPEFFADFLR